MKVLKTVHREFHRQAIASIDPGSVGAGFWRPEIGGLKSVAIGPCDLAVTDSGELIEWECDVPFERWKAAEDLHPPTSAEAVIVYILSDCLPHSRVELLYDGAQKILCIRFSDSVVASSFEVASDFLIETDVNDNLAAVWGTNVSDNRIIASP